MFASPTEQVCNLWQIDRKLRCPMSRNIFKNKNSQTSILSDKHKHAPLQLLFLHVAVTTHFVVPPRWHAIKSWSTVQRNEGAFENEKIHTRRSIEGRRCEESCRRCRRCRCRYPLSRRHLSDRQPDRHRQQNPLLLRCYHQSQRPPRRCSPSMSLSFNDHQHQWIC